MIGSFIERIVCCIWTMEIWISPEISTPEFDVQSVSAQDIPESVPGDFEPGASTARRLPSGTPYIILNEMAERYSFFGMRTLLVVYMTTLLVDGQNRADLMSEAEAKSWYHAFEAALYFFPALGAILSDALWGKYRTILTLSLVYCLGHLLLALDGTRMGLMAGLSLIAIGSGGIKPCVSAHLGDQFKPDQTTQLAQVFGWFYLAISLAGFVAGFCSPLILAKLGPHVAFGIPGLLMFIATTVFWLGRHRYVRVPPVGLKAFVETLDRTNLKRIGELLLVYAFVAFFWAMSAQSGSSWVFQAQKMDRHVFGMELLPAQIQSVSPLLTIVLVPILSYGVYPSLGRLIRLTPLHKIGLGLLTSIPAFLVSAWIEIQLRSGLVPSIGWQVLAYMIMNVAEIMIAVTCLELSYTRAPKVLKSVVMAGFMFSVSLGNVFTSLVNYVIRRPDGSSALEGASYYLFFVGVMALAVVVFALVCGRMQDITLMQGHENPESAA